MGVKNFDLIIIINKLSKTIIFILLQVQILNSCAVYTPENNNNLTQANKNNFNIQSLNNNGTLLPSDLTPLISSAQNLLSPAQDISDKSTQYNKLSNQIVNTQNELNTLSALPSTNSRELKKHVLQDKINGFMSKRDGLTQQINSSLTNLDTQKNNLRSSVNSTLGDNSSQDSNDKPANLQGYKDKIEDLESSFNDSVDSENTYGLVDATNTIADESKLYTDLVRDYTSSLLSNSVAETLVDDPDLTNLDKLTKPLQVIHYLNNRIKSQNTTLSAKQTNLDTKVNNINSEIVNNISDYSQDINALDQDSANLSQLLDGFDQELNSGGFTTQSFETKAGKFENEAAKFNNFMKKRQAQQEKNKAQLEKDYPLLMGLADQFIMPSNLVTNAIPLPGSKFVGIFSGRLIKYAGEKALVTWTKYFEIKGLKQAIEGVNEFDKGIVKMSKSSGKSVNGLGKVKGSVSKLKDICETGKCPRKHFVLPSFSKVTVDWQHIFDRHQIGGSGVTANKDLFSAQLSQSEIKQAVEEAYQVAKKLSQQVTKDGEIKIKALGYSPKIGKYIEMYFNKTTQILETAYPKNGLKS